MAQTNPPFQVVYSTCKYAGFMVHSGKSWHLLFTIYHSLVINIMGITSLLELFLGKGNFRNKVESVSIFAIYIQSNNKIINMFSREKDIRNLLTRLENYRAQILTNEKNSKYIVEAETIGKKYITILCTMFISSPLCTFLSSSLFDYERRRLTLRIWIPWSMEEYYLYLIANTISSLMAFSVVFLYATFGTLLLTFTMQMSAYVKVLKNDLENEGVKDKNIYRQHILWLQFINDFNDIFSGQTYLEILVSSIMPCGFAFSLIRNIKNNAGQLDVIQQMALCLTAPCLVCRCGQIISTQIEQLHESSYMSNWYEEKSELRKDLLMLMTMTITPTVPQFRKFVKFDHVCLATVFQGLYSFLMMIINMDSV